MSSAADCEDPVGYQVLDLPTSPALALSFGRAALRSFGGGGVGSSGELPRVAYRLAGLRPDPGHVARYSELVGAPGTGRLPLLYPNALSFPLQLALMTTQGFPFSVVGLVHLENTVRQFCGLVAGTALDLEVRVQNLRPHRVGQVFDVVTVVRQGGHVAWNQVGTFLRHGRRSRSEAATKGTSAPSSPPAPDPLPLQRIGSWALDAGLGRAFAAAAGDRNPIHLYPLTAKAFGFDRPIAHGLWTAARLTHAVEAGMPAEVTCVARFRAPVPLPSTVDVLADRRPGGSGGPIRAQLRRQDEDGTVCCDLALRPE